MRPETPENQRSLRYGYTTGACATAVALAAAYRLLADLELDRVEITLPRANAPYSGWNIAGGRQWGRRRRRSRMPATIPT